VRRFRTAAQSTFLLPLISLGYSLEVRGREHLDGLQTPCLVVSNHNMHLDWSMVFRALPRRLRTRTTVAASAADIFAKRWRAFLAALMGNAFPFDKQGSGVRESLEQTRHLLEDGWNVLIFPEGKLTAGGPMQPFKSGIGWVAVRAGVPVLPLRIDILKPGIYEGARWPHWRGRVRVTIGKPVEIASRATYDDAVAQLEQAIREA